jgi:hypothetical protein
LPDVPRWVPSGEPCVGECARPLFSGDRDVAAAEYDRRENIDSRPAIELERGIPPASAAERCSPWVAEPPTQSWLREYGLLLEPGLKAAAEEGDIVIGSAWMRE